MAKKLQPNKRIDLQWRADYGKLLERLRQRLQIAPYANPKLMIARTLLACVQRTNPTPNDVIDCIYRNDTPAGGWKKFDRQAWLGLVPAVVAHLRAPDPFEALGL